MDKVVIPVDGSAASRRAVEFVIARAKGSPNDHIHLINVQEPAPAPVMAQAGLSIEAWHALHQEAGRWATEAAEKALTNAHLRHTSTIAVGEVAHEIVERARALGCTEIVMGTRGMTALGGLIMGSVATRVVHLAPCPVTLVK